MKKISIYFTLFFFLASAVLATPICEFTVSINKARNEVALTDYSLFDGTLSPDRYPQATYQAVIEGATTTKRGIPAIFYIAHVGDVDQVTQRIQAVCDPTWKTLLIEKNGQTILQQDIEGIFCNNDNICQPKESNLFCPQDCPIEGDGYCTYKQDNICDPDCIAGEPDCRTGEVISITDTIPQQETPLVTTVTDIQEAPPVQPRKTMVFLVGSIIILLLFVILGYMLKHHKKKENYAEQKFNEYKK